MRTITKTLMAGAVAIVAAACSGSQGPTAELPADLRKDLDLVKASGLELASARPVPNQIVSAIESVPSGRTEKSDVAPRPVPRRKAPPAPAPTPVAEPAPEVAEAAVASEETVADAVVEETPVEAAPAPVEEAPAPEPAVSEEPEVVTGPQALPETGDAPVRRPRGGLGGLGGIIGVVVRGGTIGVDDCAIHPRGGMVGRGFPRGGVYGPTRPVYTGGSGGRERVSAGPRTRGGAPAPSGIGGGRTRGVRM